MIEQYNEQKELVDTIQTTAKLMGYRIKVYGGTTGIIHIYEENSTKLYASIELIKWRDNTTSIMIADSNHPSVILSSQSHEVKLAHLRRILEEL